VSVLLSLAITQVRIPLITESLCQATLTTTLPSIQSLATTLLTNTILLRHIHCPHSSLYKLCIGATSFLLDSWTLRMGLIGCPQMSVRNYHYLLCNNPEEHSSELLRSGSLKSCTHYSCQILIKLEFSWQIFKKYTTIKCHENPSSGSRVLQCRQTDRETWQY